MQNVEIRVRGQINRNWADWVGGMSIAHIKSGETVMVGNIRDQAMLRGLINRITDLGIELISVAILPWVEGQTIVREKEVATLEIDASDENN